MAEGFLKNCICLTSVLSLSPSLMSMVLLLLLVALIAVPFGRINSSFLVVVMAPVASKTFISFPLVCILFLSLSFPSLPLSFLPSFFLSLPSSLPLPLPSSFSLFYLSPLPFPSLFPPATLFPFNLSYPSSLLPSSFSLPSLPLPFFSPSIPFPFPLSIPLLSFPSLLPGFYFAFFLEDQKRLIRGVWVCVCVWWGNII